MCGNEQKYEHTLFGLFIFSVSWRSELFNFKKEKKGGKK